MHCGRFRHRSGMRLKAGDVLHVAITVTSNEAKRRAHRDAQSRRRRTPGHHRRRRSPPRTSPSATPKTGTGVHIYLNLYRVPTFLKCTTPNLNLKAGRWKALFSLQKSYLWRFSRARSAEIWLLSGFPPTPTQSMNQPPPKSAPTRFLGACPRLRGAFP